MDKNDPVFVRLFKIAAAGKAKMIASCVLMSVGTLAGMVPFLSVYFIARSLLVPVPGSDVQATIVFWASVALGGLVVNTLLSFLGSLGAHRVAFRILYDIRVRVMGHIGRLPMGFFSKNTSGSIQKTMDDSIEKIELFIAHILPDLCGSALVVVALMVGLGSLDVRLAITVLVAVVAGCALQFSVWGGSKGQDILVGLTTVSGKVTGAFSEYVRGIAEVKLFGLAGTVTRGLADATEQYGNWETKLYRRINPFYEGYKTIILSLLSVVMPVGTLLIWLNLGDLEVMLAVLMALIITPAICNPLMELVTYGSRMAEITVALNTIDEILEKEPIPPPSSGRYPERFDVEFHQVSFSYQDASDPLRVLALDEVSFVAPQNRMTALVGPSGSGKSTIGQLISRFWDVGSGKITIGGVDIRDIEFERLMDCVSFVFQDTFIFTDTVFGNITMNRPVDEERVVAAAKAAQCHEFIMRLPDGYQTRIGSGGMGLSGGEEQRLGIARAILKDAGIVVLDEALAYSDAENENLIQKAIDTLIENKTVIIIAHRLPSIRFADQIIVLDDGSIVEQGDHDALMDSETLYRELWVTQSKADGWSIERDGAVA